MDGTGFVLNRSPFWNINKPNDVNADGRVTAFDALAIINDLNLRGPRSLVNEAAGASAGEGQGNGVTAYVDVNNDNRVTAFDALQVINRLNMSGGEGEPMVRLTVQIVAAGTNDDIESINKGGFYEMRILTEDLGILSYMGEIRPATFPNGDTFLGVATSFFDVLFDTSKTDVQTNDNQIIFITGSPSVGGTFTLSVNDGGTIKTTAPITFASNRTVTADNIHQALNNLLRETPDSPDVVEVVHEPSGGNNRWRVRFINRLGSQDVPEMTGDVSGLGSATITITEDISGEPTNDIAYSDALRLRTRYDRDGNPLNDDGSPMFFSDQRAGSRAPFGINDLGGSSLNAILEQRLPGTVPTEIARIRMDAKEAGVVDFNLDVINVMAGLETAVNGFFNNPVTTDLIIIVGDTLVITEPLSADDDFASTTEGSSTPIDINVLDGDVNNPPTPNTPKTIVSLDTTGLIGTAQIVTVGGVQMVRYTPPGPSSDFNGNTSFKYTVRDENNNTDTATVTIFIAPVNDAPTVTGPNTQNINEDTPRVFSAVNGNQILLNDVDNPTDPMTLTLQLSGTGPLGTLMLGSTTGLTGTTGNGTSSITTNGTLSDLNAALEGLTYTPAENASGTFNLTITLNDNGQTPGPALEGSKVIQLNVAAVNDAPEIVLTGVIGVPTVIEGESLEMNAANNVLVQVADVDAGNNPVIVTLTVAAGNTLHVNPTADVTIQGNDTNNVTLTGTIAGINTALDGMTYNPSVTFGGNQEELKITINDQGHSGAVLNPLTAEASVFIDVEAATRPRARNDQKTVVEDSVAGPANTIDVLSNDLVNLPGPPAVFAELISFDTISANGGTITRDDGGTPGDLSDDKLIYVPAPDFFGTDTFTYTMNDTVPGSVAATGTVVVTVTAVNDAPVAVDDTIADIAEDSGVRIIPASDLISNDSRGAANEASQMLTIVSVGNAVGGTVSINGNGDVVFTPAADYNGPASFTYTVQDNGQTNGVNDFKTSAQPATVSFTITEVNDSPTAQNQTLPSVVEDTLTVTIPFADLLSGATPGPANEASQNLTISAVSNPVGGTVEISGTDVIFTPAANFNGTASFTFTVTDDGTTNGVADPRSTTATASFTITAVNDAPVAQDDTATTGEGQAMDIAVRDNDFDVDVPPFTGALGQLEPGTAIVNITAPTDGISTVGTAVVQGNGIRFTPNPGFFGTATFTYQLDDGSGQANSLSAPATVTVTVVEANDPPVANPDPGIVVDEDTTVSIDVFGNDFDPDTPKANWSFILVTDAAHGTVFFNPVTRQVEYTPDADYNGPDSFEYQINDNSPINPQNLLSNTALVSITVREVNDAPVGGVDPASGQFTVIKDRDRSFTVAELIANDSPGLPSNEADQTINITAVDAVSNQGGTVTFSGGVITYVPPAGFIGTDFFEYTLTDNGTTAGAADPKSVQVRVNLIVRDFIPTDVNGYVFRDVNNNGTYQPGIDFPLSGVEVTLSGTSEVSGPIMPITVRTNHLGYYEFPEVEPGEYHITEVQPVGLADGPESLGPAASFHSNDDILLQLPLLGVTDGVSTNNFAEGGIDAGQLINAAGLISEQLSSTTSNGIVVATTMTGDEIWSWKLHGWDNATNIQITLDADKLAATLTVNGFETRIFQNPYDERNPNRDNPDPLARLARFRILGWDSNGNYLIRLDGSAEHFYGVGHPLAAVSLSGGEYTDGVDAAMAEEIWA